MPQSLFPITLGFLSPLIAFAIQAADLTTGPPAFSVSGVVQDATTKKVIEGAEVFVENDCDPKATTGPDGMFTIPNVPPGWHLVSVYPTDSSLSGSQHVFVSAEHGPPNVRIEVNTVAPTPLPGATVDRPYSYKLSLSGAGSASFRITGGSGKPWLQLTGPSLDTLEGEPRATADPQSTVIVRACAGGKTPIQRKFVIPVAKVTCSEGEEFAWCEREANTTDTPRRISVSVPLVTLRFSNEAPLDKPLEQWPLDPQIIQFNRVDGDSGRFGHLMPHRSKVVPTDHTTDATRFSQDLVNAVVASKISLSGSILVQRGLANCWEYQWKVVTQSVDSSNILVYLPSDLSSFCAGGTLLIVLPVHAIWATAVGSKANTYDPSWKPLSPPLRAHECNGSDPLAPNGIPVQGIRPCDDKPGFFRQGPSYWSPVAWGYIRLTQPGGTQGSISLAPRAISFKGAWDSQAYVSTRLGPGWIGLTAMYEHDHKPQDDLNSVTGGLTYDWRFGNSQSPLPLIKPSSANAFQGDPVFGMRAPEATLRFGPEWTPWVQHGSDGVISRENLNLVWAETLKFPFVFNAPSWRVFNRQPQPSMVSILPVVGAEEGVRIISHSSQVTKLGDIARFVAGGDASLRWPFNFTHNFLGDKPITLDYSFRARNLADDESQVDARSQKETFSAGWRSYSRVTLIMPFSAYLQMRVAFQRGALPPLFQWVGTFLTLGVTFSNPGSSEH